MPSVGRILVGRDMANSEADGQSKPFEIAPDTEIQRWAREVQFLLNVIEPDPEYQPFVLTDEASLFDAVGMMRTRFGGVLARISGSRLPST